MLQMCIRDRSVTVPCAKLQLVQLTAAYSKSSGRCLFTVKRVVYFVADLMLKCYSIRKS